MTNDKDKMKCAICGYEPETVMGALAHERRDCDICDDYKPDHYPGCHKIHIECANKAIDDAREKFEYYKNTPDLKEKYGWETYQCVNSYNAKYWLKKWGEK